MQNRLKLLISHHTFTKFLSSLLFFRPYYILFWTKNSRDRQKIKDSSSANICCSVHTLLWTVAARIFVALDFVQLHKIHSPQSIQRWTFCKDIALLAIWRNVIISAIMVYSFGFLTKSFFDTGYLQMILIRYLHTAVY